MGVRGRGVSATSSHNNKSKVPSNGYVQIYKRICFWFFTLNTGLNLCALRALENVNNSLLQGIIEALYKLE